MNSKEYNLFIKPTEIEDVISNKDDKSTAYIILQNNILHSKHLELLIDIKNLNNEKDDLENLNDNLSRGKSCVQGIAKNQYLLSQEKDKEIYYYKKYINELYNDKLKTMHFMCIPYLLIILSNFITYKGQLTLVVLVLSGQLNLYISQNKWKKNIDTHKDIIKITDEIKKLDQSNEHLHELIDNF